MFDSDNPGGRKLWSEVQRLPEVKLSESHELMRFLSLHSISKTARNKGVEERAVRGNTAESWPVSSSVPVRAIIFFDVTVLIRVKYKCQTKHLGCVTLESSRSELPKRECSLVLISTLSALHFTFITPLKHDPEGCG